MAGKKRKIAFKLKQDNKDGIQVFNLESEHDAFGKINKEEVVRAFVNKLFLLIQIKKGRGGTALKSFKLSQPFQFEAHGAVELILNGSEQTRLNLEVKFPAALYKKDPKAAKERVIGFYMDLIQVIEFEKQTVKQAANYKFDNVELN